MSAALTLLALWVLLGAVWLAVWPFLAGDAAPVEARAIRVQELEDEKARLLEELRVLELDWQTGKLTAEDRAAQETALKARAVAVMEEIDAQSAPAAPARKARLARRAAGRA